MVYLLRRSGRSSPDSPGRSLRSERSFNSVLSNLPTTNSGKHTVSTSSVTTNSWSADNNTRNESSYGRDDKTSLRLPYLLPISQQPSSRIMGEEIKLLRRRVEEHQRKGEQQERMIRQLEKKLVASQENAIRWKHALEGDIRPGSQYRQEIASLKEELDARDEMIQERDEVIANWMARNMHIPSSSYPHRSIPTSLETSVCSSLLDEAPDCATYEVERLMSENEVYAEKLVVQREELLKLRRDRAIDEQERNFLRTKVATLTLQTSADRNEVEMKARGRTVFQNEQGAALHRRPTNGQEENNLEENSSHSSSEPFDAASPSRHARAPNSPTGSTISSYSNHRESSRTMKRLMELQNELSKVKKEGSVCQLELDTVRKERDSTKSVFQKLLAERDLLTNELKQVRNDLWKAKLHSENVEDMAQQTKFALNDSIRNENSSRQVSKNQENAFRDMSQTIVRLQAEIRKRDAELTNLKISAEQKGVERHLSIPQDSKTFNDELHGAVVQLKKASQVQTEQGRKIQDLRRDLRTRKEENIRIQKDLKSRKQNLVCTQTIVSGDDHESDSIDSGAGTMGLGSNVELDALRNELKLRTEEVERLQNDLGQRTNSLVRLRKQMAEKEMEIDELIGSKQQLSAVADRARSAQLEMQQQTAKDKEDLLKLSHDQNGRLLEKVKVQKDIISKIEKDLNEKERTIENVKSSCNERIVALEENHAKTRIELEGCTQMNQRLIQELDDLKQISQLGKKDLCEKMTKISELESSEKDLFEAFAKVFAENEKLSKEKGNIQKLLHEKEKSMVVMSRELDFNSVNSDEVQKRLAEKDRRILELELTKKTLNDDLESSLAEQIFLVEEKKHLSNLISQKNNANEKTAMDIAANNAIIDQLRQHLSKKELQILELEATKKNLANTLQQARSNICRTDADIRSLQCLLEQHVETNKKLMTELSTEKQNVGQINGKLLDKDTKISNQEKSIRELQEKFEKSAREGQEIERSLVQWQKKKEEQTMEVVVLKKEIIVITEDFLKTQADLLEKCESLNELEKTKGDILVELKYLRAKLRDVDEQSDVLKECNKQHGDELAKARDELQAKDATIDCLKRMGDELNAAMSNLSVAHNEEGISSRGINGMRQELRAVSNVNSLSEEIQRHLKEKDESIRHLKNDLGSEKACLIEARHKMMESEQKVEYLNENISRQSEEMRMLRDEVKVLSAENDCVRHKLKLLNEESGNLRYEISIQKSSIECVTKSKEELDESLQNVLHELAAKDDTIKELKIVGDDLYEQLNGRRCDVFTSRNESCRLQEISSEEVSKCNLEKPERASLAQSAELSKKELELALEASNRDITSRDRQFNDLMEVHSKACEEAIGLREKIKNLLGDIDVLKKEVSFRESCQKKIRKEIAGNDVTFESYESTKSGSEFAPQEVSDDFVVKDRFVAECERETSMAYTEKNRLNEEIRLFEREKESPCQTVSTGISEVTKLRQDLFEKTSELESVAETNSQLKDTLESLRVEVDKRDREIGNLSKLNNIVSDKMSNLSIDVKSARAETDRLKYDNEGRSQAILAENDRLKNDVQIHARELIKARQELIEKNAIIESLEGIKAKLDESLEWAMAERKEREELSNKRTELSQQIVVLQARLQQKDDERKRTEMNLLFLQQSHSQLKTEVSAKADEMKENALLMENLGVEKDELSKKNLALIDQIKDLMYEIVELKDEIKDLKDRSQCNESFDSLKGELDQSKKSENDTVQSYERQICALTMNKDVTIDTLRKDLAAARARGSQEVARLTSELSKMQEVNNELEKRCNDDAIGKKDQQIYALERTLYAQERTVDMLQTELDQLQFSMMNASEQRRSDIEELQRELMDGQTELKKQNREILSLKAQLVTCTEQHQTESKRLRADIDRLRKRSPLAMTMKDLQQTNMMIEVKQRLEQLKVTNIELKEENIKLAARLERAAIRVQTIEEEKKIAAESEEECRALRREVKELETLLENMDRIVQDDVARIRMAKKPEGTGASKSGSLSRGILGLGKRPKIKKLGIAKRIPSVLYITEQNDVASAIGEEEHLPGVR